MTRRDMSKEALKAKRSAVINQLQQLHQVLSSVKSRTNFGIDELCELSLKAVRVELAPDTELLQFEPCFFLPQPTSVFLDHPLIEEEYVSDLERDRGGPVFCGEYPTEDSEEDEDDWLGKLEDLCDHIESCVDAPRHGIYAPHELAGLDDLTPLRSCENRLPDVILFVDGGHADWVGKVGDGLCFTYDYLDKSGGTPHVIIQLEVRYCGNDTSLTHGEVCALVGNMCQWYSLREFRHHAMCPVSLRLFFTDPGLF
ncbi:hypothetical protein Aspvir_007567 [Aspergillus viridinutans]|uniref:Uncharacterized protein n=1 Tax=Aspergillus viridinutans TaxID=75553 RepID=A0A9P3BWD5_ASPVI|nr:uncharacterized protein Aspvir_007567 [Aspergillus viridinutans]GIK03495.1 hypothetical protein Aspvir_007567 [Aspergillus viridinutans]